MNINPEKPDDENRDRFVLSKGHASAGLYAVLAEKGYFPKEDLKELWVSRFFPSSLLVNLKSCL